MVSKDVCLPLHPLPSLKEFQSLHLKNEWLEFGNTIPETVLNGKISAIRFRG